MSEAYQALKAIFTEELEFLISLRNFLLLLPQMMADRRVQEADFFNFLETYEVRCRELLQRQQSALASVAGEVGVPPREVTFWLLARMNYGGEFAELGQNLSRMGREISYALLQASIYLKNFSRFNQSFQRLLDIFQPQIYTSSGRRLPETRHPTSSVMKEA